MFKAEGGSVWVHGRELRFERILFREVLGRGANGVVFLADDMLLRRPIAVKVYLPRDLRRENRLARAIAEARKLAALQHPHILIPYGAQLHPGDHLSVTTEFLDGVTLRKWLSTGRDISARLRVWNQVSSGINHARRSRVYHGDLHDRNIIVVKDHAKIIDFGTSLLQDNRVSRRQRESELILKLARLMFPEGCRDVLPRLSACQLYEAPELVLNQCGSWVNSIRLLHNLSLRPPRIFLIDLACGFGEAPFLDVLPVVGLLQDGGFSETQIKFFLKECTLWSQLNLEPDRNQDSCGGSHQSSSIAVLLEEYRGVALRLAELHMAAYRRSPSEYWDLA